MSDTSAPAQRRGIRALVTHPQFASGTTCLLGVLSLLTVLCFHFPRMLTSQEFRAVYTEDFARNMLTVGLVLTFIMGPIAILRGHYRRYAYVGLASGTLAIVLGGATVQFEKIDQ